MDGRPNTSPLLIAVLVVLVIGLLGAGGIALGGWLWLRHEARGVKFAEEQRAIADELRAIRAQELADENIKDEAE